MYCPENFLRRKRLSLHHWELVTLYNRLSIASCTRKTECSPLRNPVGKVCHSKLGEDDLFRWLEMTWQIENWVDFGLEIGVWGSRVWGMWMWCKEDWINLLSLQCAFIPNGSDMSRAQHYLPSHCTGEGRTHEKKEQEGVREADWATHEREGQREGEREGERGSNHHPRNNHNPKHENILFHCHAVIAFPITPWPWVHRQELGNTPDKNGEKLSYFIAWRMTLKIPIKTP